VSIGTAGVLGLAGVAMDVAPTAAYLMLGGRCSMACRFCAQARTSGASALKLSRVTWPEFPVAETVNRLARAVERGAIRRCCLQVTAGRGYYERALAVIQAVKAVTDVSLDIPAGTFVTLLGPSGSGKTTTLNLIAGFLTPDSGEILFDGRAISHVPPHKRNIGMVFQSYALFPHMTVFQNVAFPLRMRTNLSKDETRKRVAETLELVQLTGFEDRYPRQLSGGQQQRVSMARALVSHPRLLLMDEPLGALDKKLRVQMQVEIRRIHQTVGSTFVYVTHDQSEALIMSDLVVVMHDGCVAQVAPPRELYELPESEFVADFLGGANLLPGRIVGEDAGVYSLELTNGQRVKAPKSRFEMPDGREVSLFIRPEEVQVQRGQEINSDCQFLEGTLKEVLYFGDTIKLVIDVGNLAVSAMLLRSQGAGLEPGKGITIFWEQAMSQVLLRDHKLERQ